MAFLCLARGLSYVKVETETLCKQEDPMCQTLTDANFHSEVLDQPMPTVVVFFADWSGPCQMFAPILEQLAATYQGQVRFWKMDVETNVLTVKRYGVRRLPTLLFFSGGRVVDAFVGLVSREAMVAALHTLLADREKPTSAGDHNIENKGGV